MDLTSTTDKEDVLLSILFMFYKFPCTEKHKHVGENVFPIDPPPIKIKK